MPPEDGDNDGGFRLWLVRPENFKTATEKLNQEFTDDDSEKGVLVAKLSDIRQWQRGEWSEMDIKVNLTDFVDC